MTWRDTTSGLVVVVLLGSLAGAGACARNPAPATPASAAPGKAGDARVQNVGGLYFDPQGADFTRWVNQFKDEVYRNWIVPQQALFGQVRGHVDIEFRVERDGSLSGLRMLRSSGTPSLDRAAQDALTASRLLPLPGDYKPQRATMNISFFYNEATPK